MQARLQLLQEGLNFFVNLLQKSNEEDEELLFSQRLTETGPFAETERDHVIIWNEFSIWNDFFNQKNK